MTAELVELKATLAQSQQSERKSASLVQELTAMVKEQKSRISELIRSKKDAVSDLKVGLDLKYYKQSSNRCFPFSKTWSLGACRRETPLSDIMNTEWSSCLTVCQPPHKEREVHH